MKRVGILVGREQSFPEALIESINERGKGETVAEFIKVGGVRHDWVPSYDLIIDRISHEIPFYRAIMKRAALEGTIIVNNPERIVYDDRAALEGTIIVNNPFWWS